MPTPAIAANAYAALAQLREPSAGLSSDAASQDGGGLNFGSVLKDVMTNVTAMAADPMPRRKQWPWARPI